MRPKGRFVASVVLPLALLTALLAGCTSPPPEEPVEDLEAPPEEEEPRLVSSAEAANVTQQETEQSEFAKSLDEKFHTHNYWDGALEKLLMDEDVQSAPIIPDSQAGPLGSVFSLLFDVSLFGGGVGDRYFNLPEGSIVPPETERLEVSVSWTESTTITGLSLAYRGADQPWWTELDPLPAGGGTYTIATNLSINDMPHTSISKWEFWLLASSDRFGEPAIFNGTAHVTVTAFRNDTLFIAPPHPDHWGDNTTMVLHQSAGDMAGMRALIPVFTPGGNNGFVGLEMPNNTIVPPHTALITATLNYTNSGAVDPFEIRPALNYWPANSRGSGPAEIASSTSGQVVYTIVVTPRMVDSPYANQTRWGFWLQLDSDAPTDQGGFLGDIGQFDGTYEVTIVAERESI